MIKILYDNESGNKMVRYTDSFGKRLKSNFYIYIKESIYVYYSHIFIYYNYYEK